jgi:hypothetical protein
MRPVVGAMSATSKAGLIERYADKIVGLLGCYDRVVLNGTLMAIAHPEAMAGVLRREGIRCFDLAQFVEPLREEIRQNAERLAAARHTVRKEDLVAEKLAHRGRQPGLVCIFSAMKTCTTYRPWHAKANEHTGVKFTSGKCRHYYFHFIDPELGLCYVRVPTWAPYRLQVYSNGHHPAEGDAPRVLDGRHRLRRAGRLVAGVGLERRVRGHRAAPETRRG